MSVKLAVYTIMKNESYNVEGFAKSLWDNGKPCDYVCVLDTGSEDNSPELLKKALKGVGFTDEQIVVKSKKYKKFRFDEARNDSLDIVPKDADICLSIDLDERMCEDYVSIIKTKMTEAPDIGLLSYKYAWEVDKQTNQPIKQFDYCKCHLRNGIKWMYPIHEHLDYNQEYMSKYKVNTYYDKTLVYHYPNLEKGRIDYLSLLLDRYADDNTDLNAVYYIAREYGFRKNWAEALNWYNKGYILYMTNEKARNADPRAITYIHWNMSQAYLALGMVKDAEETLEKSIKMLPCQTTFMCLSELYLSENKLDEALSTVEYCKLHNFSAQKDQDFRLETSYYRDWMYYFIKAAVFYKKGYLDLSYAYYALAFNDIKTTDDENYAYNNKFYNYYVEVYNAVKSKNPNANILSIPERFLEKKQ